MVQEKLQQIKKNFQMLKKNHINNIKIMEDIEMKNEGLYREFIGKRDTLEYAISIIDIYLEVK